MPLYLQRKVGTVIGELMYGSGLTVEKGRYTTAGHFLSELGGSGVRMAPRRRMLQIMRDNIYYGTRDNILTGVQLLEGGRNTPHNKYVYNRWRQLMGGSDLDDIHYVLGESTRVVRTLRENPREGVKVFQDMYALFWALPKPSKEEFLGLVDSIPCDLDEGVADHLRIPEIYLFEGRDITIVSRIIDETKEEHRSDIEGVLRLLADHNICVRKGKLVRKELAHLVGFKTETIPDHWEEGHLDAKVIAEKREELEMMLQGKNN